MKAAQTTAIFPPATGPILSSGRWTIHRPGGGCRLSSRAGVWCATPSAGTQPITSEKEIYS
jgi:hypothetical protein